MLRAAGHPNVAACWNSNDTDLLNGSIRQSFALLKPWIRHVHIHDLAGTSYPYGDLFRLLREAGYSGYTMAECKASPEPERFMAHYAALWKSMTSACA
jgi:sugar phosphate isomerase/epimerase